MRLEHFNQQVLEEMSLKFEKALDSVDLDVFNNDSNSIRKLLGISDQEIDELRQESYFYCHYNEWDKATQTLIYLVMLEPFIPLHFFRLGSLLFKAKKFEEAISIYEMGAVLDTEDPRPHLYISFCFSELNDYENAKRALENCIEIAANNINRSSELIEIENMAKQELKILKV